jgi:hypothetical protein
MSLLQLADITLHSGRRSNFKLECDALTKAIGELLLQYCTPFSRHSGKLRGYHVVGSL